MKSKQVAAGLALLALWAAGAEAQSQTCNASVSKRTIAVNQSEESTWDIIFDIKAPGCDNSRGQFDYFLDVTKEGKKDTVKGTMEFDTSNGQPTAVMVTHNAKPGQEVTGVSGALIKNCICVKPGN